MLSDLFPQNSNRTATLLFCFINYSVYSIADRVTVQIPETLQIPEGQSRCRIFNPIKETANQKVKIFVTANHEKG